MSRPRVVVFYGGTEGNRDLSTENGRWICQYVPRAKFDVTPVEVMADGTWKVPLGNLPRSGPVHKTMHLLSDAVRALSPRQALERLLYRPVHGLMTLLRGKGGDDGALHSLATMLEVPLIGSSQRACALASDKFLFAQAVDPIVTTPYLEPLWPNKSDEEAFEQLRERFLPPFFMKSAQEEGSNGIHYVESIDHLANVMAQIPRAHMLAQERAVGTEFSMTILEDDKGKLITLPPTVVKLKKAPFYDHMAKRRSGRVSLHTRDMDDNPVIAEAEDIARDVYRQLGCKGIVTMDMIADGSLVQMLEVNTIPTLSRATPLAHQLKSSGFHPTRMLDTLISRSLSGLDA